MGTWCSMRKEHPARQIGTNQISRVLREGNDRTKASHCEAIVPRQTVTTDSINHACLQQWQVGSIESNTATKRCLCLERIIVVKSNYLSTIALSADPHTQDESTFLFLTTIQKYKRVFLIPSFFNFFPTSIVSIEDMTARVWCIGILETVGDLVTSNKSR